MAISRFNKIILVVHFISKEAFFGQKTPSLSYTGLTKQVFLSVSLKTLFAPSLTPPWNSPLSCDWPAVHRFTLVMSPIVISKTCSSAPNWLAYEWFTPHLLSDRLIMKQTQSHWGQVIFEVLHPRSSSSFNTDTHFFPALSVRLRFLSLIAQRSTSLCPLSST